MDTMKFSDKYKQDTIWHERSKFFVDLPLRKMKVNHKSENGTELTLKAFAHQKETLKERHGQPSE